METLEKKVVEVHIVHQRNFATTNWANAFQSLTIKNCSLQITPHKILKSQQTLTTLKFYQQTSCKNIHLLLSNCPNLVCLTFCNVNLVHKTNFESKSRSVIPLSSLKELEIYKSTFSLAVSDFWLLDCLFRGVSFGQLEVFKFRGTNNSVTDSKISNLNDQSSNHKEGEYPYESIVAKFLIKNASTLKHLDLGGLGFRLCPSTSTEDIVNFGALRLESIACNFEACGMKYLLACQNQLENLSCSGFTHFNQPEIASNIFKTIQKNCATLTTIYISPCIISDKLTCIYETAYTLNCAIFQQCEHLQTLYINIRIARKEWELKNSCGRIRNIQLLPLSLTQIDIYNREFSSNDLNAFAEKSSKFLQLKHLTLSSSSLHPYHVPLGWIETLFSSSSAIKSVNFFGGRLVNPESVRDYIRTRPENATITMTQSLDGLSFTKNS